ncbi:hypothetical protein D9M69_388400 [compost metagenome]
MPRRVLLVLGRQPGALGQRRVQDGRVRLGEQQARGIAARIAHDLAARRVGGVLGIADRAQRRAVEDGAVVQVQDEHRGIGRHRVQFIDGRQPLLGELVLGKTADHAHPLRCRRARDLVPEHAHGIGQRTHAVPAQLHVVVQAAADDVHVAVDQPGNGPPAVQVHHLRLRAGQLHHVLARADGDEAPVADGHGVRLRVGLVERGELAVDEDEVGGVARCHGEDLRRSCRAEGGGRGDELPAGDRHTVYESRKASR